MHIFPLARSLDVLSKRVVFQLTINNFLEHKNVHIPNMLQQYLRQVVEGMVVVYVGVVEGRVVWGRRLEGALTPQVQLTLSYMETWVCRHLSSHYIHKWCDI